MRLLYLTHNVMGQGGSYLRAFSLARAIAQRGHQVSLMAGRSSPGLHGIREKVDGVELLQPADVLPFRIRHGGLSPLDCAYRLAVLPGRDFDLVHSFDHRPAVAIPAWVLARQQRVPLVSDWADLWGLAGIASTRPIPFRYTLGAMDHFFERRWRQQADAVTVINDHLGDLARVLVGPERPVIRVLAGSNTDQLETLDKAEARRRLGLMDRSRIVAHIGYAAYDEELLSGTLIQLAAAEPAVQLLTSGRAPAGLEGGLRPIGKLDCWRHFDTVPYRQLGILLSAADVLLLPYSPILVNLGRFPNKLGDYLAAGRPIVTNPTGDVGQLVLEQRIGLCVPANAEEMALACQRLLTDRELASAMGGRGRALAEGKMSWSAIAARTEDFYYRLTG